MLRRWAWALGWTAVLTLLLACPSWGAAQDTGAPDLRGALLRVAVHDMDPNGNGDMEFGGFFISPDGYFVTAVEPLQLLSGCCAQGAGIRSCANLKFQILVGPRGNERRVDSSLVACGAPYGVALLHVEIRPKVWIPIPRTSGAAAQPTAVQLLTGAAASPLTLAPDNGAGRFQAEITAPGARPGQPAIGPDGRLAAVLEMIRSGLSASNPTGLFVGNGDLGRFLARFWFDATVSPPVLNPQTHTIRVQVTPLLGQLEGLSGTVRMEAPGWDVAEVPLALDPHLGRAELPVPGDQWDDPPSWCHLAVSLSDAAGHTVALRRYKLRVTGWSSLEHPRLSAPTSPVRKPSLAQRIETPSGKPSLGRLSTGLRVAPKNGSSSVTITDSTVRDVAAHRLISKNYEKLPVGTIRSVAQRYDSLRNELPRMESRLADIQHRARHVTSWYDYLDLVEEYNRTLDERSRMRSEITTLKGQIQGANICRCPDKVWYLRSKAPCKRSCTVP